ncbi:hypothetical protein [Burkholderia multivorans]|nr:hypothetical protein [Burkholderia multivorans]MBU9572364.1 hypothetical protein [Burkholderia multivorans]MDR8878110.1 dTDP-glucose 4,6-dehydratase [Burkholderia multivorans]MDR8884224.1 dTDP-glucose 4,6-dehydratase [Burkholderia multivorans]MDR8890547.1 dTDP-glucose 4,6-dehydratase [Burkholderia multivorans]MDR8896518.1 dTDP-glucose 4,6-dehydratase [Burkholderia multivorans]
MILVTGGAGFTGANLVRDRLSRSDAAGLDLDELTYACNLRGLLLRRTAPKDGFAFADICDRAVPGPFADHRPRTGVYFTARSHADRSPHRRISSKNRGRPPFPGNPVLLTFGNLPAGRPALVRKRGQNVRDRLHVGDHCSGIGEVLTRGTRTETYNFRGSNEKKKPQWVRTLCTLVDNAQSKAPVSDCCEQSAYVVGGHDRCYGGSLREGKFGEPDGRRIWSDEPGAPAHRRERYYIGQHRLMNRGYKSAPRVTIRSRAVGD